MTIGCLTVVMRPVLCRLKQVLPPAWSPEEVHLTVIVFMAAVSGLPFEFWRFADVWELLLRGDKESWTLIACWAVLCFIWIGISAVVAKRDNLKPIVRKGFHALGSLIIGIGLVRSQVDLLAFSLLVIWIVFVSVEFGRHVLARFSVCSMARVFINQFVDDSEHDTVARSHIHLLTGLGWPVVMCSGRGIPKWSASLWIGILTTGIGDSAASLVGRRFNASGSKSFVGAVGFFVAAALATLTLIEDAALWKILVTLLLSCVFEATTKHNDNFTTALYSHFLYHQIESW